MSWNDGSTLFENDASFHERLGLAGSGGSFEAVNSEFPNFFLRHSNFHLFLQKDDGSDKFKDDATFHKRAPFTTGNLSQESLTLNLHNGFRNRHCSPPLIWSAQAAAAAQEWAQLCTRKPQNPSQFMHCNDPLNTNPLPSCSNQGENLAWGSGLALNNAARSWYSEVNNYNFGAPVFTTQPPLVGHFTQIVWLTTKEFGCASAICGGETLWVCRYLPPGNINVVVGGQVTAQIAQQSLLQHVPKVSTSVCP